MNPTREEYQAERWRCAVCSKAHNTEQHAIDCCLCSICGKRQASQGSHWERFCELCFLRTERERARKQMKAAEEWVIEQRRRLEAAETDLRIKMQLFEVAAAACKPKKKETEEQPCPK
jgi:hypothetical protein